MTESEKLSQILIKGGHVVNDDHAFDADILIEGGKIKRIAPDLKSPNAHIIDAKGLLVMPGGIDPRTRFGASHLGTSSVDDFYHGTRSALAGGTTMILDCVVPEKSESLVDAFSKRCELANANVCCDYSLYVSLPAWNKKLSDEMGVLTKEKGTNSFVVSLANVDNAKLEDSDLYHCFARCRELGALLQVHAENGNFIKEKMKEVVAEGITGPEGHLLSRPEECEAEAVYRTIAIAKEACAPVYITKVMSRSSADVVAKSRKRGAIVFGECTAAALGTNGFHVFNTCWRHAAGHVTSPPLRADLQTAGHLMELLANGDLQSSASDNCTYNADQKALGKDDFRKIPSGVNGVEDRMSVVWEKGVVGGKMDLCRFVAVTSTAAAKIFNLYPKKGRIAEGSDADVVVWNPNIARTISSKTHHQNCDFNVFEGLTCHGAPAYVVSCGQVVRDPDGLHVSKGSGHYIPTTCDSLIVYGRIREREKSNQLEPVEREPYMGPVFEKAAAAADTSNPITPDKTFHHRTTNLDGQENGNGAQGEDGHAWRTAGYRVNQPPGGKTSQLW